jgi:pimeloyl-ACP methyl ester carboxylesterase
MNSNTVYAEGIRMRWEERGEGRPVILLHGIPTSPRLWRHVAPQIRGSRVLAWEMVGYGDSMDESREHDISVARQAGYLASWMREVGLESALVVGHDLGGGVAQILAAQRPELVEGLVLTNSISYDSWPILPVKALRTLGPAVERMPTPLFRAFYGAFLRPGHDSAERTRESFRAHWPYYEAAGPGALVRQAASLDPRDTLAVADRIPDLGLPARIVWGAADRFQDIGYGYRLAYELGAPLDRIEGGKHFVPEDHPGRVAVAINELLEETSARG